MNYTNELAAAFKKKPAAPGGPVPQPLPNRRPLKDRTWVQQNQQYLRSPQGATPFAATQKWNQQYNTIDTDGVARTPEQRAARIAAIQQRERNTRQRIQQSPNNPNSPAWRDEYTKQKEYDAWKAAQGPLIPAPPPPPPPPAPPPPVPAWTPPTQQMGPWQSIGTQRMPWETGQYGYY